MPDFEKEDARTQAVFRSLAGDQTVKLAQFLVKECRGKTLGEVVGMLLPVTAGMRRLPVAMPDGTVKFLERK